MRTRKLTGWTNRNPVDKDGLERTRIILCGDKRHAQCVKDSVCWNVRPECAVDKLRMAGKKVSYASSRSILEQVMADDLKKIAHILRVACGKCHKVEVLIGKVQP